MKKLFILTNSVNKLPQKLNETESLSTEVIRDHFSKKGFEVNIFTYGDFINNFHKIKKEIRNSYFLYASSQYPDYFSAIEDILLIILKNEGILIPDFMHFRAHENKYIQELIKSDLSINSPRSSLISTIEEGLAKVGDMDFPAVAKLSAGYGSTAVELIKNKKKAVKYLHRNLKNVVRFRKNIFRYIQKKKEYFGNYPEKTGKIILQEYIKDVSNDWKILVFGNRIFYLKRYVRKNDFRASGSGSFDNSIPPGDELLNFCMSVKKLLDTPWVSLDVIEKSGRFYLIEYQCVHFGLYTVLNSKRHFEYINGNFVQRELDRTVDDIFAEELFEYISKIENNETDNLLWKP